MAEPCTVPGMTGNLAPRPVRGTPLDLWAAVATPAKEEKGRLKDLELRTFDAHDEGLAGGTLGLVSPKPTVLPLTFFGTCGNFRFLVDNEAGFCDSGSGVFGSGIETGFCASGGGRGSRRPEMSPEAADLGTRSGWLQFLPVADLYCWSIAKRPLRTAFRSKDRFSRDEG